MKTLTKRILTNSALLILISTAGFCQQENQDKEPPKRPTIKQLFKDLDKDEDGKISLKEVKGPLKKDFKKIDKNEDGFLTKEEIEKAPKPKKRERPNN